MTFRIPTPKPGCCQVPREHRRLLTGYWYRAVNGRHCWPCDGRSDMGWQWCRRGSESPR